MLNGKNCLVWRGVLNGILTLSSFALYFILCQSYFGHILAIEDFPSHIKIIMRIFGWYQNGIEKGKF